MKKSLFLIILNVFILSACNFINQDTSINYLDQQEPGLTPELFAPGLISTDMHERDICFSPDGKEVYYTRKFEKGISKRTMFVRKLENGKWGDEAIASFSGTYDDIEPMITKDGKQFYFASKRPLEEGVENKFTFSIWYMNKTDKGWSEPKPVPGNINGTGSIAFPVRTKSGLYVTKAAGDSEFIYFCKYENGRFLDPVKLSDNINMSKAQYNAFISYEDDMLIMPREVMRNDQLVARYHVSFKDENDEWGKFIDLGEKINMGLNGWSEFISPDGKHLFLHLTTEEGISNVYWVSMDVIYNLKKY